MNQILAKFGYVQNDESASVVGLADDQFDPKYYVIYQKTNCPTRNDVALGHDQIHTTFGEPDRSAYGGLELLEMFDNRLEMTLSTSAAEKLDVDTKVSVPFDLTLECLTKITEALKEMAGSAFVDRRAQNR